MFGANRVAGTLLLFGGTLTLVFPSTSSLPPLPPKSPVFSVWCPSLWPSSSLSIGLSLLGCVCACGLHAHVCICSLLPPSGSGFNSWLSCLLQPQCLSLREERRCSWLSVTSGLQSHQCPTFWVVSLCYDSIGTLARPAGWRPAFERDRWALAGPLGSSHI